MTRTVEALLAVGLFVCCWQWSWTRVAAHTELSSLPKHSRRRVQWLIANSSRIEWAGAGVAAVATVLLLVS